MSGDMNTALGNCLLMLLMVLAFMCFLDLKVWDTLDDGDDCLLIVEEEDLDAVLGCISEHFLHYGMVVKVECVAASIHEVVFCQSMVIEYDIARFKFVRDYRVVISKSLTGIRFWQDPNYRIKVLRATGLCELVLNLGVPVLQAFAVAVLRNVGRPSDIEYASDGLQARARREFKALGVEPWELRPRPITEVARSSFEIAFGLSPADQIHLEERLAGWTFETDNAVFWGPEWDVPAWLAYHSTVEVCPDWQNAESKTKQAQDACCQHHPCSSGLA